MQHPSGTALFITQHFRPELIGSAPLCTELAEWLAAQGIDTTVVTGLPHYPGRTVFPDYADNPPRRERWNGLSIIRLHPFIPAGSSALSRILGELSFLAAGIDARLFGRIPPKSPLVISLCPSVLAVALGCLCTQSKGRHIALVHDIQSGLAKGLGMVGGRLMPRLLGWCERTILNRVDLIAVLTEEMKSQLRQMGVTADIEIIPVWVNVDQFPVCPTSPDTGPATILYSGNFGLKQGMGQLLALAEELRRRRFATRIILRGNGNQGERLKTEIAARGLDNIEVQDLLPPDQLWQGLASGDIHLVPQDPAAAAFAMPSKVFNIMAAGRPFVATAAVGSPLWRLHAESGAFLCAPPNDATAFTDAVLRLVEDSQLRRRLGANGRHFVERHYSKAHVLEKLLRRIATLHAEA